MSVHMLKSFKIIFDDMFTWNYRFNSTCRTSRCDIRDVGNSCDISVDCGSSCEMCVYITGT